MCLTPSVLHKILSHILLCLPLWAYLGYCIMNLWEPLMYGFESLNTYEIAKPCVAFSWPSYFEVMSSYSRCKIISEETEAWCINLFSTYIFLCFLFFSIPPLKASETSSTKFKLTPSEAGPKHLLVNFSCDKFADIKTFKMVNVIN